MLLYSTNRDLPRGFKREVSFREALFMGQAPDGGLFMPRAIPRVSPAWFWGLRGRLFHEMAAVILHSYLEDELSFARCRAVCAEAFNFEIEIEDAGEDRHLLRLDQGPTASFKDFAARLLAKLIQEFNPPGRALTVLVSTSGDTGSAVGEAFKAVPGVRVFILYPKNEVSPLQKRQLDTIGGGVTALALAGKFDDCQALAKQAFADPDLAALNLISANSINFGRVIPQIMYYVWAWARLAGDDEALVYSVPSGNFGNAFACELARRMGLPVKRLILAVNENDQFPRFMSGQPYLPTRPSKACLSNSMNVGHPSNLARFFDAFKGTVDKDGNVWRLPDIDGMRQRLFTVSVTDEETKDAIRTASQRWSRILEPHGAVAWRGLEAYRQLTGDMAKAVILETAHPAKFPETVREVLGIDPSPPDSMRDLATRTGEAVELPADYAAIKEFLLKNRP